MDIATELILGFGRTLKAIRTRENLSQKELAEGVGISSAILKRYEQENLDLIGPNGFSISIFAKLADYLDQHPKTLFEEIVSHTDLALNDDDLAEFAKLFSSASKDTLGVLVTAGDKDHVEEPFGNNLTWALSMAAIMTTLPGKKKAEIGLEILRAQLASGLVEQEDVAKEMQDLFSYSLSND